MNCSLALFCATIAYGDRLPFRDPGVVRNATEQLAQPRYGTSNPAGIVPLGAARLSVTENNSHILTVGPGQQYPTVAAAINASHDGDTILVQAGTYINDFQVISRNVTLQGVGGMVNLVATKPIPNDKAIFVINGDVTISRFSFTGARVSSRNGAGIRYDGGHLVLNDDSFHDNEEGLLGASDPTGTITINRSEFSGNGSGDGQTHNIYVNEIAMLTINDSYIHDAVVGHEVKSRARETVIRNSRIYDGAGTASYSIDLPNGGRALVENNVIEQGPKSENPIIISIGEEGNVYAGTDLVVRKNQILNHLWSSSALGIRNATSSTAQITGNKFYGLTLDQIGSGLNNLSDNSLLNSDPPLMTDHPWRNEGH